MSDMHHRVGLYEPRWISYHAGQIDGEDHSANLKKLPEDIIDLKSAPFSHIHFVWHFF